MVFSKGKKGYVYVLIFAILLRYVVKYYSKVGYLANNIIFDTIVYVLLAIVIWEGNRYISTWLDTRVLLLPRPGKRILIHFSVGALFSTFLIFLFCQLADWVYYRLSPEAKHTYITFALLITLVYFTIIFSIAIGASFFVEMRKSFISIEKYKAESLQAQLQNLKNQINPHFLFNNLSVLSSLVYTNQDKAVDFIHQLSKVYRYLLDNRNYGMVTLEKELDFINAYTYLLKIRFEEKLNIHFNISPISKFLSLPPMALQILVENAIKHNEISAEKNLTISIIASSTELELRNNSQLRKNTEPGSKTGLQNIKDRYKYFTEKEIQVIQDENYFVVKIPLLNLVD